VGWDGLPVLRGWVGRGGGLVSSCYACYDSHTYIHTLPHETGLRVPVSADVMVSVGDGEK